MTSGYNTLLTCSKITFLWEIDSKDSILIEINICGLRYFNDIGMLAQGEINPDRVSQAVVM